MPARRSATLAGRVVAALAILAATACGGGGVPASDQTGPTTATTTPTPSSEAQTEPATGTPSPTTSGTDIAVTVADGRVEGGVERIPVELGDPVRLTVTSDVADEIHVHVYDVTTAISAGGTATVTFTADVPGVMEIELEESGVVLVELEVR